MELRIHRSCACCGDRIRGRSDKRFCDDVCRNRWHNQHRRVPALTGGARNIQRRLVKNRGILVSLLGERVRCLVWEEDLVRAGFYFEYFSHRFRVRGVLMIFCLDMGYRKLRGRRIQIERWRGGVGIFR